MNSGALKRRRRGDHDRDARDAGAHAYYNFKLLADNPHEAATPAHREWARGWRYARHLGHPTKGQKPKFDPDMYTRKDKRTVQVIVDRDLSRKR
jgi:hypothetical protein